MPFEKYVTYLGIFIDEKLNFQKHIKELLMAIENRLNNIIKMFAGSKWGGYPHRFFRSSNQLPGVKLNMAAPFMVMRIRHG